MLYLHLHIVTRTGVMSSGLSEGVRALGGGVCQVGKMISKEGLSPVR